MTEKVAAKRAEVVAGIGLLFQILFSVVMLVLAAYNNSAATLSETWHYFIGIAFWGIVFAHLRQRRLAREEELEVEELEKSRRESLAEGKPLFEGAETESYTARGRLSTLEKWVIPAFSVIVAAILIFVALRTVRVLWTEVEVKAIGVTGESLFILAGITFISFMFAKYASGMASVPEWRLLRAGGSYLMSNTIFTFLALLAVGFAKFGYPKVDRWVAYVIPALMGLLGVEIVLNFILDFYRPRIKGQEVRPPYDSRMLSLVTEPGGILKTVAHTLDYQFGFKVSETWFYRFLEKAIAPLILFQLGTLYLLTCFVIVGPDELGIVERFGRPPEEKRTLASGLHMKLPWPFEKAYRYPAKRMLNFHLGYKGEVKGPLLWTIGHYEEEYHYLVATELAEPRKQAPLDDEGAGDAERIVTDVPVTLADITVQVYYKINDLYDYVYNQYHDYGEKDPEKRDLLLKLIAERELVRYMVTVDIDEAMTVGRDVVAKDLKNRIQKEADKHEIGVDIRHVAVESIHPPVPVGPAYEDVIAAEEDREATILDAKGREQTIIPNARMRAEKRRVEAEAYRIKRTLISKAEAERFLDQLKVHSVAPEVYELREYLRGFQEGVKDIRKFIIPEHPDVIIQFETEQTVTPGLTDLGVTSEDIRRARENKFGSEGER
jgi:regulator of protease activity HflC (stomatin/prohibitin superfamily)